METTDYPLQHKPCVNIFETQIMGHLISLDKQKQCRPKSFVQTLFLVDFYETQPNANRTLHKEWMCLLHTVTPLRISNEKLVNLRKRRNIFEKALGCTDDVVAIQRVKSLWWSNTALEEEENKYKRYKFCYVPTYCIILSCIETIEEWSQLAGITLVDQVIIWKSCHSI